MADESGSKTPNAQFTEDLPARQGGVSAIASAGAPFIYFDGSPNFGYNNGIVNVTLEAVRFVSSGGSVVNDRVVVAHLRMSLQAAIGLRGALDGGILMAAPTAQGEAN